MDLRVIIGKNLRKFRLRAEMSQEKLALEANVDRTYVQSIEKGQRNVSVLVLERLSKALDINIVDLIRNDKN